MIIQYQNPKGHEVLEGDFLYHVEGDKYVKVLSKKILFEENLVILTYKRLDNEELKGTLDFDTSNEGYILIRKVDIDI